MKEALKRRNEVPIGDYLGALGDSCTRNYGHPFQVHQVFGVSWKALLQLSPFCREIEIFSKSTKEFVRLRAVPEPIPTTPVPLQVPTKSVPPPKKESSALQNLQNDPKYKTELCYRFPKCPKGEKCAFAHGEAELRNRGKSKGAASVTSSIDQTSIPKPVPQEHLLKLNPIVVDQPSDVEPAVTELRASESIAVDCEGVNLSRTGKLTLIQIATESNIFLFDIQSLVQKDSQTTIKYLKEVLEAENIKKVMHDCRQDASALYFQLGIRLKKVCDTQVLYGMYERFKDMVSGSKQPAQNPRVGLNRLLLLSGLTSNPQKEEVNRQVQSNQTFWQHRPLTPEMKLYAACDVAELLKLEKWLVESFIRLFTQRNLDLSQAQVKWYLDDPLGNGPVTGLALNSVYKLSMDPNTHCAIYEEFVDGPLPRPQSSASVWGKMPNGTSRKIPPSERLNNRTAPTWSRDQEQELSRLIDVLPESIKYEVEQLSIQDKQALVEILLSCSRLPILKFEGQLSRCVEEPSLNEDIEEGVELLLGGREEKTVISNDNRAGLPGSLHRISVTRGRQGEIYALTYRVGRAIPGTAEMIRDLLSKVNHSTSLLVLGRPGVGKTTLLRDICWLLSETMRRDVVVVDTSNEIAGDHVLPHPCIGRAHRMQVAERNLQYHILNQAVQNQSADVVIVDELATKEEVSSARTISAKGVGMIATAHGGSLHGLLKNTTLRLLVGGVERIMLSDAEARKRIGNSQQELSKIFLERSGPASFQMVVEVVEKNYWRIFYNVEKAVDQILLGETPVVEERWMDSEGMWARCVPYVPAKVESRGEGIGWFQQLIQSCPSGDL